MGLHFLDFIGSSPTNYIFKKSSNKTNFGGVLFLIYILGIIGFSVYCIIKFCQLDNYSIEYFNFMHDSNHKLYNPNKKIEFIYDILSQGLYSNDRRNLSNKFSLMNIYTNETIQREVFIPGEIDKFHYCLVYECEDDECEIKEDIPLGRFYVPIVVKNQKFSFQEENPIVQNDFYIEFFISVYDHSEYIYYFDENICSDGNKNVSILAAKRREIISAKLNMSNLEIGDKKYRALGDILFIVEEYNWEHYKRKKKSFLDTLSYILSVGTSSLNAIKTLFFMLYSNSFDNYKIIQDILSDKNKKLKKKNILSIKIKPPNNSDSSLNIPMIETNNENEEHSNINIEDPKILSEDLVEKSELFLPKLSFFSYIFNFFYSEKCKSNMKNQIIISKCNDIVSKYYSIENILHNQILIENILKDYKWNDPLLKDIKNNELIMNLSNCIKSDIMSANS